MSDFRRENESIFPIKAFLLPWSSHFSNLCHALMQNFPAAGPTTAPEAQPAPEAQGVPDAPPSAKTLRMRYILGLIISGKNIPKEFGDRYDLPRAMGATRAFDAFDVDGVFDAIATANNAREAFFRVLRGKHGPEIKTLVVDVPRTLSNGKTVNVPFMTLEGINRLLMLIGHGKKWFDDYRSIGLSAAKPAATADNAADASKESGAGPMDGDDNGAGAGSLCAKGGKGDDGDEPSDDDGDNWGMGGGGRVTTLTLVEEKAKTAELREQLVVVTDIFDIVQRTEMEKRSTIAANLAADIARFEREKKAKDDDLARKKDEDWATYEGEKETLEMREDAEKTLLDMRNNAAIEAIRIDKLASDQREYYVDRERESGERFEERKKKRPRAAASDDDDGGSGGSDGGSDGGSGGGRGGRGGRDSEDEQDKVVTLAWILRCYGLTQAKLTKKQRAIVDRKGYRFEFRLLDQEMKRAAEKAKQDKENDRINNWYRVQRTEGVDAANAAYGRDAFYGKGVN